MDERWSDNLMKLWCILNYLSHVSSCAIKIASELISRLVNKENNFNNEEILNPDKIETKSVQEHLRNDIQKYSMVWLSRK